MQKTKINQDVVFPEVPNERDECVSRIIKSLEDKRGIDKVHVVPEDGNTKAQLCFHYNPSVISIAEIETKAKEAGAEITEQYGHLLIEVSGVRHTRHARIIEAQIKSLKGIINVSVSGTGFIQLEYNKENTSEEEVVEQIKKSGVIIHKVEDFHTHEAKKQTDTKEPEHEHKHDDHDKHDHAAGDHEHAHGGIFGERTELIFAIICGSLLGIGFGLSFVKNISFFIPSGFYIGAYFFGGFYTTKEAI